MELITTIYAVALGFEQVDGLAYWVAAFLAFGLTGSAVAAVMPALLALRQLIKGA